MIKIKGHEINPVITKVACSRKSQQFKNKIETLLKHIGVSEYDTEIPLEPIAIKKVKASATWWLLGHRMHYSCNTQNKFVDNLYLVFRVIELEINSLISEEQTIEEFIRAFSEKSDVDVSRKKARELLGLDEQENDFEIINKKYKDLAKELHPDKPTGNVEKFKELNNAHKILKRELS
ncbi:MAG: J domain-containing protein [Candidatus Aenigmarchaeota archaeon]|nr:J domain-containing protein [Candidatus Aenigmarchaeota archaeon]